MAKEDFVFFWDGIYSPRYPINFVIDGVDYNSAEQYMMAKKALLFNDNETYSEIMKTNNPAIQKILGKRVKNFNKDVWERYCRDYVRDANYAKFTQNPNILAEMLNDKDKEIVAANPNDKLWGIGLEGKNHLAWRKETWKGTNWLGIAIMEAREQILAKKDATKLE